MSTICGVCMHRCRLEPGQRGICGARANRGGVIVCENYGQITGLALDPIEKKPLKRYRPGSLVLSAGSYGCNLKCPFCQNYEISIGYGTIPQTAYMAPQSLADTALHYKDRGNIGVAFTYNEPLVGWEYVRDTARLVKERGMDTVLVTNGSASLDTLAAILPWIDAMNIDLKGFREAYYHKLGGNLNVVKEFIKQAAAECHVELTTLIVPGENDSVEELEEEAEWIASLDPDIPLHVTRFFPQFRMTDREATDVGQIYWLADAARRYLKHVFVGNC
ncbi:MAG: AmmeMemoRadiSam system radical SAM enzyme [Eubacterium sp.]|jgi:pyruvate formate lyase activating enzyme|nr:AmmeMemoRadiSam system radical SAM enzyme [Eubacterium sp.]NBI86596.1 AmmeMemoRadiSam system radical SAM enzyme [Lachnospiraceae bacterium]